MNTKSKESNLMTTKLSTTPALHLHDICLIMRHSRVPVSPTVEANKQNSFPTKTASPHLMRVEECENKESRSGSVDEYRIPPFVAHDLFRQSEEGRDPSSPPKRKPQKRNRQTKHFRNSFVLDGSTGDMQVMLSGSKRHHRRSHNQAFVSQQFNEIFEDVFMAPAPAEPNR